MCHNCREDAISSTFWKCAGHNLCTGVWWPSGQSPWSFQHLDPGQKRSQQERWRRDNQCDNDNKTCYENYKQEVLQLGYMVNAADTVSKLRTQI